MKKLLFIYNPYAGKGQIKAKLAEVVDIFVKANYEVTIYPTQAYMDAYEKVFQLKKKFNIVVCSGGDGTLGEVVGGMMKREPEHRIPIGYIPSGSTNDFANSLSISKNMLEAAQTAVSGTLFQCDVGSFNGEPFVYIAAFGLFTDVSYQTKQEMKNLLGHVAYVLEGVKRLYSIESYQLTVTHDDQVIEGRFIYGMVTNSRSVGGFRNMVGKSVVFDDGEFEVMLIKMPKNLLELNEIIASLLIEQIDTKHMYSFKTHQITFESAVTIPWTLDGEFGGDHEKVIVENKTRELKIMVSTEKVASLMEKPQRTIEEKEEKEEKE